MYWRCEICGAAFPSHSRILVRYQLFHCTNTLCSQLPPLTNMPTNQAAWFHSNGGPFTVGDAPMPQLAGDEILIWYIGSGSREDYVVMTLAYRVPVLTPSLSIPPTSPSGRVASSLPPCQLPSAVTSPGSSLLSATQLPNSKSETEFSRSLIGRLKTG